MAYFAKRTPMLTPEESKIVDNAAKREGPESARELAEWFAVRRRVAQRAKLSGDEAMKLAVAEQHTMRAETRAARAGKAKAG